MSQENVELQHRLTDAFNRRDLDAYLALTDEDIEAIPRVGGMEGGYHGHDGTRRWWTDLLGAFPDFSVEFYEVHDMGGNLTLAAGHARGHGAGSDTPDRAGVLAGGSLAAREVLLVGPLGHTGRSLRSRRPLGVGDVARERGDSASRL